MMRAIPFPTQKKTERGFLIVPAAQIMKHIGCLPNRGEQIIFDLGGNAQACYRVEAATTVLVALKYTPRTMAEAITCAA